MQIINNQSHVTAQPSGDAGSIINETSLADDLRLAIDVASVPDTLRRAYELAHSGDAVEAGTLLRALPATEELNASSLTVLGSTWRQLGQAAEAVEAYEGARVRTSSPAVLYELIQLYRKLFQFSTALERCEEALPYLGHHPEIQMLYAECLLTVGRYEEGMAVFSDLVASGRASEDTQVQYLWYLFYRPGIRREEFREGFEAWAREHAPAHLARQSHTNTIDPERRLRIGYLSPDFRTHSVVYTFEPLLTGHDRRAFEVYGYGKVAHPDETTARLRAAFDHYQNVWGHSPQAIADQMVADGIDILVTIGAHYSTTCLQVLARKPAPVQIDIGSFCTTGLTQVDYRIADVWESPVEFQTAYTEPLVHLPSGYMFYQPHLDSPEVQELPALKRGHVTFGFFGSPLKINDEVARHWTAILQTLPQARLLIKSVGGDDPVVAQGIRQRFAQQGLDVGRITIRGWLSKEEHWQLFHQVDVALDPWPFNGCLGTLEALWMGVPVMTWAGPVASSRMGVTILHRVGLGQLVSETAEAMVAKAVGLANNLDVLARLRQNLRGAVANSSLCNHGRVHSEYEAFYRDRWRHWCSEGGRS